MLCGLCEPYWLYAEMASQVLRYQHQSHTDKRSTVLFLVGFTFLLVEGYVHFKIRTHFSVTRGGKAKSMNAPTTLVTAMEVTKANNGGMKPGVASNFFASALRAAAVTV